MRSQIFPHEAADVDPAGTDLDIAACLADLDRGDFATAAGRLAGVDPTVSAVFGASMDQPWASARVRGSVAVVCCALRHPRYVEQLTLAWDELLPWAADAVDVEFWAELGVLWAANQPRMAAGQFEVLFVALQALQMRATTAQEHSALIELVSSLAAVAHASGIEEEDFTTVLLQQAAQLVEAWAATGGEAAATWANLLDPLFAGGAAATAYRMLLRALEIAEALPVWQEVCVPHQRRVIAGKLHLMLALKRHAAASKLLTDALLRPHQSDRMRLVEWGILACNLVHALRSRTDGLRHVAPLASSVHFWLDWVGEDPRFLADAESMRADFHEDAAEPQLAAESFEEAARCALIDGRIPDALKAMNGQWLAYATLIDTDDDTAERLDSARVLIAKAMALAEEHDLPADFARWGLRRGRQLANELDQPDRVVELRQLLNRIEMVLETCDDEHRDTWCETASALWRSVAGRRADQPVS